MRVSGGVGLLIRKELLEGYTVEILDADVENILWVKMRRVDKEGDEPLCLAVCYILHQSHLVERLVQMNCSNY